jgi:hypothetical protein
LTHAHCAPAKAHGVLDAPVDSSLLQRALLAAPGLEVLPAVRADSLQTKKGSFKYINLITVLGMVVNPSSLGNSWIRGAADEAVLKKKNNFHKIRPK